MSCLSHLSNLLVFEKETVQYADSVREISVCDKMMNMSYYDLISLAHTMAPSEPSLLMF